MFRGWITVCVVFFSTSVFAKNVCYNLFRIDQQKAVLMSGQASSFREISFLKENLSEVRNVQQLKDGLYEIASQANQMMDSLVEIIIIFDRASVSKKVEEQLIKNMRELSDQLQRGLGVTDKELISAVKIRVGERIKEDIETLERSIIQQPIGFLRPKQGPWKEDAIDQDIVDESQKQPIGFNRFKSLLVEEESKPQKMGFGRSGVRTETESDPQHQAGYQRYPLKDLERSTFSFQFFLNLKTGYFDVEWWF